LVSPLEPGVAQLALWTADDLARAGRPERTVVLPVGLQYGFTRPVWPALEALIHQLERDAGLSAADRSTAPERLYGRLLQLAERILTRMEAFYRQAYPHVAPAAQETGGAAELGDRLSQLMETALRVVEQVLAVEPHGDVGERCRRLEQAGWERLYPSAGAQAAPLCALDRGLVDRLAEETAQRLWHMRLVESFVAVSGRYVRDRPSQERFADTLLILWDTLCRLKGGNPERRPQLGPRRALVTIGAPLTMEPWLEAYRSQRRAAVADLTTELQHRLEALIVPSQAPGPAASGP
jgi:hypothetical protein